MDNLNMQMYSLRKFSFEETIAKLSNIGYSGVELFCTDVISVTKTKRTLKEYNMKVVGMHTPINVLARSLDNQFLINDRLENKYIICPVMQYTTDNISFIIDTLKNIGKNCYNNGFRLLLHNHTNEFSIYKNDYVINYILDNIEPDYLGVEFDCYWAYRSGIDLQVFVNKLSERCPLIHIKDCNMNNSYSNVSLGCGNIKIKDLILDNKDKTYIYEREIDSIDPWTDIADSYNFYKNI